LVTITIPVLTFIAGLWWNRADGDRRERRAAQAAASATFRQMQRDTHLELQDSLEETFRAATRFATTQLASGQGSRDEFHALLLHAVVLFSRIADPEVRTSTSMALESINMLANATTEVEIEKAADSTSEALTDAVDKLGALVREPPSV
jgi:hypothetical protein